MESREVTLSLAGAALPGVWTEPVSTSGAVVFAHGSGSSRLSPRNQAVAGVLHRRGFSTLLFDLLTSDEAEDRSNVFDIELLGSRLEMVVDWVERQAPDLPIGLFGASTGGAAALWAAGGRSVAAVVVRGGRPDLTGPRLEMVEAPVLLIVGGRDATVLELNRSAALRLRAVHDLRVVPGAGHLFEGRGELQTVAGWAAEWFATYLTA